VDAFNVLWRAQCPIYFDSCIDIAADPNLGADNAYSNTTYFQTDGIHLTVTGQNLVASYVSAEFNRLIYSRNGYRTITSVTLTPTLYGDEKQVTCNPAGGSISITAPSALAATGVKLNITNIQSSGANTCSLVSVGGQTFNGAASPLVIANNTTVNFISNGTQWITPGNGVVNTQSAGTTAGYNVTGATVSASPQAPYCPGIVANGCGSSTLVMSGGACVSGTPTDDAPTINACTAAGIPIVLPTQNQGAGGQVTLISNPISVVKRDQVIAGGGRGAATVAGSAPGMSAILNLTGGDAIVVDGMCPTAQGIGGTCTREPQFCLGVSAGAFSGTATVIQAGSGCGTGSGVTWEFVGQNLEAVAGVPATPGTASITPVWSGGAVASATVTPGTSAGYAAPNLTIQGTYFHDFNIYAPSSVPSSGDCIDYEGAGGYAGDANTRSNVYCDYHQNGVISNGFGNFSTGYEEAQVTGIALELGGSASNSTAAQKIHGCPVNLTGTGNFVFIGDADLCSGYVWNVNNAGNNNELILKADDEQNAGNIGVVAAGHAIAFDLGSQGTTYNMTPRYAQLGGTGLVLFANPVASPVDTTKPTFTLSGTTGGSCSGTEYYQVAGANPSGTSASATEQSIVMGANNAVIVTWTALPQWQYMLIGAAISSGAEAQIQTTSALQGNTTTYTDTCTLTRSGAMPSTSTLHQPLGYKTNYQDDLLLLGNSVGVGGGGSVAQLISDPSHEFYNAYDHTYEQSDANGTTANCDYTKRGSRTFIAARASGTNPDGYYLCGENAAHALINSTNLLAALGQSTTYNDTSTVNGLFIGQTGVGTNNPLAYIFAESASSSAWPLKLSNANTSGNLIQMYSGAIDVFSIAGSTTTINGQVNIENPTAAVSGTNQSSNTLYLLGNAWSTSSQLAGTGLKTSVSNTVGSPTLTMTSTCLATNGGLTATCGGDFSSLTNGVKFTQIITGGGTPTMAAGAAAGSSPTCTTISGFNMTGYLTCTTGTATTTGVLATISFSATLTTAPLACSLQSDAASTVVPSGSNVWVSAPSTSSWTINVAGTALTASTAYSWYFSCR
jgi:hypothetical protein